jgi:hypothetical protein
MPWNRPVMTRLLSAVMLANHSPLVAPSWIAPSLGALPPLKPSESMSPRSIARPVYAASAKPASAHVLTSFVTRSIVSLSNASETGGLANCSRFVTRLQPARLPAQAARQLPDQSTTIRVESSSTDNPRLRGALPL